MELQQYNLFFLYQETFALTKRLFIQLKRRPSTLLAGILQPIIWLFLFGALLQKLLHVETDSLFPDPYLNKDLIFLNELCNLLIVINMLGMQMRDLYQGKKPRRQ